MDISLGNKIISLSTGKLAPQADGAVLAQMGKTVVLATVVKGALDLSKDYFPLSVEFVDKFYAGGVIKGGKWMKRDGGPSDTAVLFGRIIDRSIRPLFPMGFKNEVQVMATVLSNDKDNDVVVTAFTAVSAALMISGLPFNGPVSAVRLGLKSGEITLFPTLTDQLTSDMDLLICKDNEGVNMIEADAKIIDNEIFLKAIEMGFSEGNKINDQLNKFAKEFGKPKFEYTDLSPSIELQNKVEEAVKAELQAFIEAGVDGAHMAGEEKIKEKAIEIFAKELELGEIDKAKLMEAVDLVVRKYIRVSTLNGKRYDKRAMDQVRPLNVELDILPCTHGSALFERGLTQALTVTTLGPLSEEQHLQDSSGESTKHYIHYYSAAPFSTGQTGRTGRPGRREIGHGALAEKALMAVIPTVEEFPYTIILTSEVMSQNGSSSMASTCGSTMSLMAAGVPIKSPVAGISVGMVSDDTGKYILLTDIAGIEDHCGDMDFKITGTKTGITAIQLDIKRMGLSFEMIKETFAQSLTARLQILEKMESVLAAPRTALSSYAPKIKMITLPEDKIGEVIGSGGKTIKALMEKFGTQIDIDDFGRASISSLDQEKIDACAFQIESMVREVQMGEQFEGEVTRVENFGAFVEFLPGREALLHVSEMTQGFLSDPNGIIKISDKIKVQISGYNDNHQIKLSAPEFKAAHPAQPNDGFGQDRPPRPQFDNRNNDRPRSGGFRNFAQNDSRPRR